MTTPAKRRIPGIQERRTKDGALHWRVQIRLRGHEALSRTFDRKTDAVTWLEATKAAIRRHEVVSSEAGRTTLREALDRYAREVTPKKKGAPRELGRIAAWQRHPLADRFLTRLTGADFALHRDKRREEGAAEQTIRLELALISHMFETARRDWGMNDLKNPIKQMRLPSGSKERDRRLEAGEEARLLASLREEDAYLEPLARFAIETAMRQSEILGLTWSAIDLERRVAHLADTKNGSPRDVPLSPAALLALQSLPRPLDASAPIFPVTQQRLIRQFRAAAAAAGLENLKFHDLRHEAVSRLFERGLNLAEVAAISGHRTWSQLRRYTHIKAIDLAKKLA